jgi:hypothetical protein
VAAAAVDGPTMLYLQRQLMRAPSRCSTMFFRPGQK